MIHRLSPQISNKIAAGEVVERPSSVVKELVENAIDANATHLTIEIKDAGKSLIRITDNGDGIAPDDLPLLFERHATSKIEKLEDIYSIASLGFRGEALASIASVSRIELITKTATMTRGYRIFVNQGLMAEPEPIGTPDGTTLIVRDLFYNTPVRYKFLKSDQAEQAAIINIVNRLALSHPEIHFSFIVDGKTLYSTDGRDKLANVIHSIYGAQMIKNLLLIDQTLNDMHIYGYISTPQYTRGNRQYQNVFINGRYVISKDVQDAANQAYKMLVTIGKFPAFILNIKMASDALDVNIHPAKTEIKFRDAERVKQAINQVVANALNKHSLVPSATIAPERDEPDKAHNKTSKIDDYFQSFQHVKANSAVYLPSDKGDIAVADLMYEAEEIYEQNFIEKEPPKPQISPEAQAPSEPFSEGNSEVEQLIIDHPVSYQQTLYDNLRVIGVLFNTYIIAQREDSAYLIDQHAAHERVLYERFIKAFNEDAVEAQHILAPIIYQADRSEYYNIEQSVTMLNQLGITIEPFGDTSWVVRAVPSINGIPFNEQSIYQILDNIKQTGADLVSEQQQDQIIRAACRSAVKARDYLNEAEIQSLFEQLRSYQNPYTCPHGRPIIIELSEREIEKLFKRT